LFIQGLDGKTGVKKNPIALFALGDQHRADLHAIAVQISRRIGAATRYEPGWDR
jgi:hypothetical protein